MPDTQPNNESYYNDILSGESEEHNNLLNDILDRINNPELTVPLAPLEREKVEDIKSNRELKRRYARYYIRILVGQLLVMNIVFISLGRHWLEYDNFTLNLYMGGTMAEVFGIVLIVTKHLFPTPIKRN